LRAVNQSVSIDNGYFGKVPFDLAHWQTVAAEKYPNGLPEPHSHDPTQWLFKGEVVNADAPHNLQVAMARLLGYRWPDQPANPLDTFAIAEGIACLPALGGEDGAAKRLAELLAAAY